MSGRQRVPRATEAVWAARQDAFVPAVRGIARKAVIPSNLSPDVRHRASAGGLLRPK